jgi:hypothetical protein
MLRLLTKAAILGAGLSLGLPIHAALVVTTNANATSLANTLVGAGVTISGATLIGTSTQQGTFTGGVSAGIGIESGVILTSGNANAAPGPNTSDSSTAQTGTGPNLLLETLIPAAQTTADQNQLSFSFTTGTGTLSFQYVFASEEYNEFVNSGFNDVFGFFVDGMNIALIPGTSTPVAINNVNCGNPFSGSGPNCALYNNNDPNDGGVAFNLQYDGFTDVFSATISGLTAGQPHTMVLAIGDTGDTSLDSAVFLKAGSFTDQPISVPEPGTTTLFGVALLGFFALRRRLFA